MKQDRELTDRQSEVLSFIEKFIRDHGYPPTLRDIGRGMGIKSPNGVISHLNAIRDKGYIQMTPVVARSIVVLKRGHT